jgi:hypothetical protein
VRSRDVRILVVERLLLKNKKECEGGGGEKETPVRGMTKER